jgi:hypothetical protein
MIGVAEDDFGADLMEVSSIHCPHRGASADGHKRWCLDFSVGSGQSTAAGS